MVTSEIEGLIIELLCLSCGFRCEKPEAYIPAHVHFCPERQLCDGKVDSAYNYVCRSQQSLCQIYSATVNIVAKMFRLEPFACEEMKQTPLDYISINK